MPTGQRVELTERDRNVLRALAVSRVATAAQLAALVGENLTQGLSRRLQRLHHAGFLHRPRNQSGFTFNERRQFQGRAALIYALGDSGADCLAELGELSRGQIRWDKKNRDATELFLAHALMVTELRAALSAAFPHGTPVECYHWDQGDHLRTAFWSDEGGSLVPREHGQNRHVVAPDGFCAIELGRPGARYGRYYFVEADRSTMQLKRFARKLRDYFLLWRFGLYRQRYGGIDRFRVLTITRTRERRDSLCELSRQADDKGVGSRLFLFASEEDLSLARYQALQEACCVSPVESGLVPLW